MRDWTLGMLAAFSRIRVLLVLSTLILALAVEIVSKMALAEVEDERRVTLLYSVFCFVVSGGALTYVASVLDDCRQGASTATQLREGIGDSLSTILAWGALTAPVYFASGLVVILF